MKKTLMRTAALLLSVGCMATLAGCGGKKTASTDIIKFDTTGEAGMAGFTPFAERVTISVPVYDRGLAGYPAVDNNYWTSYVQQQFGDKYNITVKYVAIPRTDVMTKYSMLIAAQETPTILMEYDYPKVSQWATDGAMQEIDLDSFKHIAPTYYQKMVENDQLVYTQLQGKTYFVLAERPYYNTSFNMQTFCRMDWLRKIGYDHPPKNYDEYCDVMDKIIAAGLTDQAPQPLSIPKAPTVLENFSFRDFPVDEEEWVMHSSLGTAALPWEPTRKFLKRTNAEYHKGYTTREFELDLDNMQARTDFVNGKTFSYGFYVAPTVDWLNAFYKNNPDGELVLVDGGQGYDGVDIKTLQGRADSPFGMIVGFSSYASADQLKAAWMYMEWMSQADNLFIMQNGFEGINYTLGDDGYPVMLNLEGSGKPEMLNNNDNKDMWCIVVEVKTRETIEDSIRAIAPRNLPQDFTQAMIDGNKIAQTMAANGQNYTDPIFAVAIESEAEYAASLFSLYQEYFTKLGKCDPSEFEDLYAKFSKEYLDAGYQEVIDERLNAYRNGFTTHLPEKTKKH